MESKDLVVLITGILVFISSLANIGVAIWREHRHGKSEVDKNEAIEGKTEAETIIILQEAMRKQAAEDAKLRDDITDLRRQLMDQKNRFEVRLAEVERKRIGPFLLEIEFLTSPEPVVTKSRLRLISPSEEIPDATT